MLIYTFSRPSIELQNKNKRIHWEVSCAPRKFDIAFYLSFCFTLNSSFHYYNYYIKEIDDKSLSYFEISNCNCL